MSYSAVHENNEPEAFADGQGDDKKEQTKLLRQLLQAYALTNRMLSVSWGSDSGIADRRSGQIYYIDVSLAIPIVDNAGGAPPTFYPTTATIDTSKISSLVSPSLNFNDISWNIGVDAFSFYRTTPAVVPAWAISLVCRQLQAINLARTIATISGDNGNSLSGTSSVKFYGELPTVLNFELGYMSPIAEVQTGSSGSVNTLDTKVYPMVFNNNYLLEQLLTGIYPTVPGSPNTPFWASSNIYALNIRLYFIPTITPRTKIVDGSNDPYSGHS